MAEPNKVIKSISDFLKQTLNFLSFSEAEKRSLNKDQMTSYSYDNQAYDATEDQTGVNKANRSTTVKSVSVSESNNDKTENVLKADQFRSEKITAVDQNKITIQAKSNSSSLSEYKVVIEELNLLNDLAIKHLSATVLSKKGFSIEETIETLKQKIKSSDEYIRLIEDKNLQGAVESKKKLLSDTIEKLRKQEPTPFITDKYKLTEFVTNFTQRLEELHKKFETSLIEYMKNNNNQVQISPEEALEVIELTNDKARKFIEEKNLNNVHNIVREMINSIGKIEVKINGKLEEIKKINEQNVDLKKENEIRKTRLKSSLTLCDTQKTTIKDAITSAAGYNSISDLENAGRDEYIQVFEEIKLFNNRVINCLNAVGLLNNSSINASLISITRQVKSLDKNIERATSDNIKNLLELEKDFFSSAIDDLKKLKAGKTSIERRFSDPSLSTHTKQLSLNNKNDAKIIEEFKNNIQEKLQNLHRKFEEFYSNTIDEQNTDRINYIKSVTLQLNKQTRSFVAAKTLKELHNVLELLKNNNNTNENSIKAQEEYKEDCTIVKGAMENVIKVVEEEEEKSKKAKTIPSIKRSKSADDAIMRKKDKTTSSGLYDVKKERERKRNQSEQGQKLQALKDELARHKDSYRCK